MSEIECIDGYEGDCEGAVEYRLAMSGTGISYPRCDHHFEIRWETQERLARDYGIPVYYYGDDSAYSDDY
jgi:hypothetical protein